MIDSHCHLDFPVFDPDRGSLLTNCQQLGISAVIIPGTQADHWHRQIALCQQHPSLHFTLGLHPYFLSQYQPAQLDILAQLLSCYPNVLAVGEIGLDAAIKVDMTLQLKVFQAQLGIAKAFRKPLILHHRKTHNQIIQQLKRARFEYGGIIHGFSGSLQQAEAYIDMGFLLGVGATISYPRAQKTRNTVTLVPEQSLVLETDAPNMPLNGRQGQRNSPEYLVEVLHCLAELRQQSQVTLAAATDKNVKGLFGI